MQARETVVSQMTGETIMADHMIGLSNLLRIGISHICYIRGLFDEKYFSEKSVLSPEMKNDKLILADHDLSRLIDWIEKGVYDSLQKKYLKTLLFCISEKEGQMIEEYAFSFSYPKSNSEEITMSISRTGYKKGITTFNTNASEFTPDQMRRYGCQLIRALASLTKTADSKEKREERTIVVKLVYYDDITPEDYEPPCAENEAINIWNRNPFKMEVGNVNSKDLVLSMKVKGFMDSCDDDNAKGRWDEMRVDNDSDIDGDFSDTQPSGNTFGYVLCTSQKKFKFILDSGATHHICNDETIMRNLREVKKEHRLSVYSLGGKELSAERMGCIDLKNMSLNPAGLIPTMAFNVVSVGQLTNQGLMICCGNGQFSIYNIKEGTIVGEGYLDTKQNEYVIRTLKWSPEVDKLIEITKNDIDEGNDEQEHKVWLIDTGCAQHLVLDKSMLTNLRKDRRPLQSANGTIWSSHMGKFKAGKLVLDEVLCCEGVQNNLISGPMLDKTGYRITFCGKTCTLVHKDGLELRGVAIQDDSNNTYYLTLEEGGEDNKVATQRNERDTKRRRFAA